MDTNTAIVTIIVGLAGGLGGASALAKTIFDIRQQKKKEREDAKFKQLITEMDALKAEQREDALNQSKLLLLLLINFFPKDHQSILSEAEKYRFTLNGNTWMIDVLKKWADKEDVNIDYIINYHVK